jgi:hypothetical protein
MKDYDWCEMSKTFNLLKLEDAENPVIPERTLNDIAEDYVSIPYLDYVELMNIKRTYLAMEQAREMATRDDDE